MNLDEILLNSHIVFLLMLKSYKTYLEEGDSFVLQLTENESGKGMGVLSKSTNSFMA